jgi:hypothetical protein
MHQATRDERSVRWEERLYPGLGVVTLPPDSRVGLAQALGTLGVEAEHFLDVLGNFSRSARGAQATRTAGDLFLWQLEASARRLVAQADTFELASQTYLAALEASRPEIRKVGTSQAPQGGEPAESWWPAKAAGAPLGEPIEMSLRRCGYAYRHVVAAHVATSTEAVAEYLTLALHALRTLPPAGVLPASALYAGLYELTVTFQGHVLPHYLSDLSAEQPGLLSGIALLRRLDATQDRSVEADLAWARTQLASLEEVAAQLPAPAGTRSSGRKGLIGFFRRGAAAGPSDSGGVASARTWAEKAEREWRETIAALEALRAGAASTASGERRP